jgi:group I intron endonuclease
MKNSPLNTTALIYKITNLENGKLYIGQTIQNLKKRWRQHKFDALKQKTLLSKAICKYGKLSFSIEIVEELDDQSLLDEREVHWISYFNSFVNGYNSTSGGFANRIVSDETKEKLRRAGLGRKQSEETKRKRSEAMTGMKMPPRTQETRKKLSDNHISKNPDYISPLKGRTLSKEHIEKLSLSHIGKPSPKKGIKLTEEQREKTKSTQFKKGQTPWNKGKVDKHKLT